MKAFILVVDMSSEATAYNPYPTWKTSGPYAASIGNPRNRAECKVPGDGD